MEDIKVHARMVKECEVWTVGLGPPVTYLADATRVAAAMIREAYEKGYRDGYDTAYLDWQDGRSRPEMNEIGFHRRKAIEDMG
jgi:hypothetical protein